MLTAQARNQIALLVGNDIAESDRLEVEQLLAECEECRQYRDEIAASHAVLQDFAAEDSGITQAPSLWDEMQPVVARESVGQTKRSNRWLVALCAAALVMAMVKISGDLTTGSEQFEGGGSGFAPTSVSNERPVPQPRPQDEESAKTQQQRERLELR